MGKGMTVQEYVDAGNVALRRMMNDPDRAALISERIDQLSDALQAVIRMVQNTQGSAFDKTDPAFLRAIDLIARVNASRLE